MFGLVLLAIAACDRHIGCDPVLGTEQGQLEVRATEVIAGACDTIRAPGPVLVGTRICPQVLDCGRDVPGCETADDERLPSSLVRDCFVPSVEGAGSLDGECVVVEDVGEVTWIFTTRECEANNLGYAPTNDRLTLPSVAVDTVTARLESPGDALARRDLVPGGEGSYPEDAGLLGAPVVHVLADAAVPLAVVLDHPDHDGPVAWNPIAWTAEVVTDDGEDLEAEWTLAGLLVVAVPAGVEATVDVVGPAGERSTAGRVRGVAEGDLASLEVLVGYAPGEDDGPHGPPIGARAVFRTADRVPVYGVPVEWTVTAGAFALWRGDDRAWGPDYVALMDEDGRGCHAPPEDDVTAYRGVVVATRGDLSAEVELRWTEDPERSNLIEDIGEAFGGDGYQQSDLCQGPGFPDAGCGCRADGGTSAVGMLVLFGLLRLRRRRSPPRSPVRGR